MIAQVGRTEDGNLCIHVQTKRTMFTVTMTPEEGRELAENIIWSIEILCGKKAVDGDGDTDTARIVALKRAHDCICKASRQLRTAEGMLDGYGERNIAKRIDVLRAGSGKVELPGDDGKFRPGRVRTATPSTIDATPRITCDTADPKPVDESDHITVVADCNGARILEDR